MSKERELLKKVFQDADDGVMSLYLYKEVEELLAQPEQPPMTQPPMTQLPCTSPPMTLREMYQRGYAAAERDLKREPLSDAEITQAIQGMSKFGADMFKSGVRSAEITHGITGVDDE